jgi:glycosyltransferase involved in cell wall biosynthesis
MYMKSSTPRILFIKPANSSFIVRDEAMLAKHYPVKSFLYVYGSVWRHVLSVLQMKWWLLKNIFTADILFIWFSDYHSWLPVLFARIFRKKSFLAIAGYDVAYLPELNYGVFVRPFRGWCSRTSLRHADHLLPVAAALAQDIKTHAGSVRGRVSVVPFGFSPEQWQPSGPKEADLVLTVSLGDDMRRVKIKGLDLFLETAHAMPEARFVIIGPTGEALRYLQEQQPANLQLIGPMPIDQLVGWCQRAGVYAQLSMREGLPNAVIEAMMCECVPVGTIAGGIPEAVEGAGFVLPQRTIKAAVAALQQALHVDDRQRKRIRELAIERYRDGLREKIICDLIGQEVARS